MGIARNNLPESGEENIDFQNNNLRTEEVINATEPLVICIDGNIYKKNNKPDYFQEIDFFDLEKHDHFKKLVLYIKSTKIKIQKLEYGEELRPEDDSIPVCAISLNAITEVSDLAITKDGKFYSKELINAWLARANSSPYTREVLNFIDVFDLKDHRAFKDLLELTRQICSRYNQLIKTQESLLQPHRQKEHELQEQIKTLEASQIKLQTEIMKRDATISSQAGLTDILLDLHIRTIARYQKSIPTLSNVAPIRHSLVHIQHNFFSHPHQSHRKKEIPDPRNYPAPANLPARPRWRN